VKEEVALVSRYDQQSYAWLWLPIAAIAAAVVVGSLVRRAVRGRRRVEAARFSVPEQVTPFTVLGLLRDIQHNNGLSDTDKIALGASIDRLEKHYFAEAEQGEPDLRGIAVDWVAKTSRVR
jgi:hypothetical protein